MALVTLDTVVTRGYGRLPLSNVVPFTYRDGATFADLLYGIRDYMVGTLHPEMIADLNKVIELVNGELAEMGEQIIADAEAAKLAYEMFMTAIENENAETLAEVNRRIMAINNKTGPVDIQRILLDTPTRTLTISPLWPDNQPVQFVVTQDATGGRLLTTGPEIVGTVAINPLPNTVTDFVLVPDGTGKWRVVITPTFNHLPVDASLYGATGDGIKDETAALNAAFLANPGRTITIPSGNHLISTPLTVPSNTVVQGEAGTVITNTNDLNSSFFTISSGFGSFNEIAVAVGCGDKTITTKTSHGLNVGDIIQLQSQRVSTSSDGGLWRLGYSTGNTSGPYFGEFATVYSVESPTVFTLDTGLIFPGYMPNNSLETDIGAASSARIRRLNSNAVNVVIRDLNLSGPSDTAIRVVGGIDCLVDNVRYNKPNPGRFIQFQECYRTRARDCFVDNKNIVLDTQDHAQSNSYHVVSSQASGFERCIAIRGTQCFDITYSNSGRIPSVNCFVSNCEAYSALFNPVTTHPGTYGTIINNNKFLECRASGISCRSLRAQIIGNTVTGSLTTGKAGIVFTEGSGQGSLVSGNMVTNFDVIFGIFDGAGKPYGDEPINIMFTGNHADNFKFGFKRTIQWKEPFQSKSSGITINGNYFRSEIVGCVGIETSQAGRGIYGLTIANNEFHLAIRDALGRVTNSCVLLVTANSTNIVLRDNVINEAVRLIDIDESVSHKLPEAAIIKAARNELRNTTSGLIPASTSTMHIGGDRHEPHAIAGPHHLDNFKETTSWRLGTISDIKAEYGYPRDGILGWGETQKIAGATHMWWHEHNASGETLHFRRFTTVWTAWTSK